MLFWAAGAQAQDDTRPKPCSSDPGFQAFDFWIGEWDVFDRSNGKMVGNNTISSIESGCALIEKWQGASGSTGTSLNLYDPLTKKWRQLWVAPGYNIDIVGGLDVKGSMVLEGVIHYYQGPMRPFRGTWTALENGDVRQYFQEFDPDKEQWVDWFDGLYIKTEQ
jgi:hypothetical protein